MTQRESRLSRIIVKAVAGRYGTDVFMFKVWGNDHMMAGLPDLIGCLNGQWFSFETKLPESRDKVSPRQEYTHSLIKAAGGMCAVVCSPAEALEVLETWFGA